VALSELPYLDIEISILGPLERIEGVEQVVIGLHGLVVERGRRRGLLLPQVAGEQGWTPEVFIAQACVKAGLPSNAWTRGAALWRFEAEVFGDACGVGEGG
jgi:uncharacterized protein (TIGR00296 family)